jgi:hypothetical protein
MHWAASSSDALAAPELRRQLYGSYEFRDMPDWAETIKRK